MSSIGDWPADLPPVRAEWYLQPNSQTFLSPVTRSRQAIEGQGYMWLLTATWRFGSLNQAARRKAQRFEALLDKLRGQVNTVNIFPFANCGMPLGPRADMSSLVDVVSFTDGSGFLSSAESPAESPIESPGLVTYFSSGDAGLTVYGNWPVGAEQVLITGIPQGLTTLYAGDHLQLGNFLYRLQEDLVGNGLNRGYAYLNRPLVEAVPNGFALITTRPRTPMSLIDDDQTRMSISAVGRVREYTASFREALFFLNDAEQPVEAEALSDSPDGSVGTYIVFGGYVWTLG